MQPSNYLQWHINVLWPSDAIWQHGSGSTLAQVMPDGAKPLSKPTLTYHQLCSKSAIHLRAIPPALLVNLSVTCVWRLQKTFKITLPHLPGANELTNTKMLLKMLSEATSNVCSCLNVLSLWGLVTPNGPRHHSQHWFKWWLGIWSCWLAPSHYLKQCWLISKYL